MDKDLIRYWNHGPHYQFRDSIIFLTWRLAFTLPQHILKIFNELSTNPQTQENRWTIEQMQENDIRLYQRFLEYDDELALFQNPGISLNEPSIASIVSSAFHFFAGDRYELHAYCIMSNHVHLILRALKKGSDEYHHIADIVQSLKRFTAREINKSLGQKGQVWDHFYFDRVIRDIRNYENVVQYILMNPVKAKLVDKVEDWRDSFFDSGFCGKL